MAEVNPWLIGISVVAGVGFVLGFIAFLDAVGAINLKSDDKATVTSGGGAAAPGVEPTNALSNTEVAFVEGNQVVFKEPSLAFSNPDTDVLDVIMDVLPFSDSSARLFAEAGEPGSGSLNIIANFVQTTDFRTDTLRLNNASDTKLSIVSSADMAEPYQLTTPAAAPAANTVMQFQADGTSSFVTLSSGDVTIPDGTSAAPGLALATELNTGFYKGGTNRLSVSVGGTDRFSFTNQGLNMRQVTPPSSIAANEVQIYSGAVNQLSFMGEDDQERQLTNQDYGTKQSVRVATTANGALATAFANGQTVDGIVLATGDRILIKNQAAQDENGVYVVNASGAPTRASDFTITSQFALGTAVLVQVGTANAGSTFFTSTLPAIVGTNNWVWTSAGGGGGGATDINGLTDGSVTGSPTNPITLDVNFTTRSYIYGDTAGDITTANNRSVFIGTGAGNSITSGIRNVFIGDNAAQNATTAQKNVVISTNENATNLTSGSFNVVIGADNTGDGLDTGLGCVAIGNQCRLGAGTLQGNVSIGIACGSATSGADNVCIGNFSGFGYVSTSTNNVAIGQSNLAFASGANNSHNVAIGTSCIQGPPTIANCQENVAIGRAVFQVMTSGARNCGLGRFSGVAVTTGNDNILIGGDSPGVALTTGSGNVSIGTLTAATLTTGSNNILIGSSANVDTAARAGAVAIGNGITTAAADSSFSVIHRTIAAGTNASFTGNELHADTSSKRYKRDIVDLDVDVKTFMQLRPVHYRAKKGHSGNDENPKELDKRHIGFIAEEMHELYKEFVTYEDDDHQVPESVQYGHVTALLTKICQQQELRIRQLEDALKAK